MEWRDEGILLVTRQHGEHAAIIDVFTPSYGMCSGVVRGGASRKMAPVLQPGAQLDVTWKARLEDHLGAYMVEPIRSRAALVLGDPLALAGMTSALGLLAFTLPERQVMPDLYVQSATLLDLICATDAWPLAYLRWEVALLEALGFGLDLQHCAVTGQSDDLAFVSPKTGRAVARHAAGQWKTRLLPFVPCMVGDGPSSDADIAEGLRTTGHFLEKWVAPALGDRPLPQARRRFVERLLRA
ncbi:MAG: DNA repair protein RecO [Planktomarina sp.]